ncbi:MAG: phosphotransferase family protein [Acidimicrobiales bacterium]
MTVEDLSAQLASVVGRALGDSGARIGDLIRLSGGASRETWAFNAIRSDGGVEPLILRRDHPGAGHGMAVEARALRAAAAVDVPVPRVLFSSDDVGLLGSAFIVMERIEGETIARKILRDDAYASARPQMAAQCGLILARLHRIDPAAVGGLDEHDPVAYYRDALDELGQPHPAFELALRWLDGRRPSSQGRTVVHGDFRNGNLIVGPDGVRAVLDWELVHTGDPLEDLGWLCVKAWRFGNVDLPVGGFGTYDQLIDAYQAESGLVVDREALRWWQVLGTLKWGVACITQVTAHTSGVVRSVELAAIGRRVCENEWDLMEMIT